MGLSCLMLCTENMTKMRVTLASHHFVVERVDARTRPAVVEFVRTLVHYKMKFSKKNYGRTSAEYEATKVFAAATADKSERRFHINHLDDFKKMLRKHQINDDMVEWIRLPLPEGVPTEYIVRPAWTDLPSQMKMIEYTTSEDGPISRLVEMQTGGGKSYGSMRGMEAFGRRTCIIVKPKFKDNWIEGLKKTFYIDDPEIVYIKGSEQLMSLMAMCKDNDFPYKAIIISNATYRNYLSLYEQYGKGILDMGYACLPQDMFEYMGVGFRLIDEVHEDFHLYFKCDLYTHVSRSLSLSATLISDDRFIAEMMKAAYPKNTRYEGGEYVRYVHAYSLLYRFKRPEFIKSQGSQGYSHHEFEKSVMKHPRVLLNYFDMVRMTLENTYFKHYAPGNRGLVFFISIEMCTRFVEYLKEYYPHLLIRRYIGNNVDPRENLLESDLCITTLQNGGTGHDIKDLTTVVLTIAIQSSGGNLQGLGRLRNLKDGRLMEFVYFVNEDNDKHLGYHEHKQDLLRTRALKYYKRIYTDLI